MKKIQSLLTIAMLVTCSVVSGYAQTLKITDVDSDNEKLYSSITKRNLGKNLIIEEFDKSVRVKLANEQPLVMKKVNDNEYHALVKENDVEIMVADLYIKRVVGVTTQATFTITIAEKQGYRRASYIVTAKRF